MLVVSMLGDYRARIRRSRRRRYLAVAALGIGVVWFLASLIHYFSLPVPGVLSTAIVLTLLLPIAALIFEVWRKPSLTETAALADKRLDNSQRLITSIELMSSGAVTPLAPAQIDTSASILGRVRPKALFPTQTPWSVAASGLGLLLLALGLFMLKGGGFSPFGVGTLPPDQPVVASLAAPTADTGLPPSELTPEPTPTSNPQEVELGGGQQPGDNPDQSGNQPGNPEEQAAISQQAQSDLDRLQRALDGQSVTQQAADALKQGNTDEAAKQITELGKENDQVSQAAKEGLADALDQAAQETTNNRQLQQAEQEAAEALRDGEYKQIDEAMENLAQAMEQTAGNVVPQQQLAESFPEQGAQPTPGAGDQQAGSQPGEQPSQPSEQGSQPGDTGASDGQEGSQPEEGGGGGDSGQQSEGGNDQSGQGGGQQPETGEGESSGSAPGQGTRVNGPKDTSRLNVSGNPFELEAEPGQGNPSQQPDQQRPGLTLDGGSGSSGASPVTPGEAVNIPGETGNLPLDRWDIIRKFFTPEK